MLTTWNLKKKNRKIVQNNKIEEGGGVSINIRKWTNSPATKVLFISELHVWQMYVVQGTDLQS